jgi:hypothetical protein
LLRMGSRPETPATRPRRAPTRGDIGGDIDGPARRPARRERTRASPRPETRSPRPSPRRCILDAPADQRGPLLGDSMGPPRGQRQEFMQARYQGIGFGSEQSPMLPHSQRLFVDVGFHTGAWEQRVCRSSLAPHPPTRQLVRHHGGPLSRSSLVRRVGPDRPMVPDLTQRPCCGRVSRDVAYRYPGHAWFLQAIIYI